MASFEQIRKWHDEALKGGKAKPAVPAGPVGPPPPQNYNPPVYDQQLASQLSPGSTLPAPIQGQFPMQGQAPMGQQPGFGQGGFNPMQGLFGAYTPQGGMFSGLFGGQ
jgi:hypothetical protein